MGELVVASKGQLEGNAERLDGHNRDRSHKGADAEVDEWVLLPVDGGDLVDHEHGKGRHSNRIYQETWANVSTRCVREGNSNGVVPGRRAYERIVSMVSMSSSGGACSTMMTAPRRHMALPSFPNVPSSSLRK